MTKLIQNILLQVQVTFKLCVEIQTLHQAQQTHFLLNILESLYGRSNYVTLSTTSTVHVNKLVSSWPQQLTFCLSLQCTCIELATAKFSTS